MGRLIQSMNNTHNQYGQDMLEAREYQSGKEQTRVGSRPLQVRSENDQNPMHTYDKLA